MIGRCRRSHGEIFRNVAAAGFVATDSIGSNSTWYPAIWGDLGNDGDLDLCAKSLIEKRSSKLWAESGATWRGELSTFPAPGQEFRTIR